MSSSSSNLNVKKFDDSKMKHGRANQFKKKFETGKLRDMLREKCRIRIKESREKNFNLCRNFLNDEKNWLAVLLKEELKELDENYELQDMFYNELMNEFSEWLVNEYEKDWVYNAEDPVNVIVCPICQIQPLKLENSVLNCTCGFRLNYNYTLQDYWRTVERVLAEHEAQCNVRLTFFIEPKNGLENVLNAICKNCDYYATLIE